MGMLFGLVEMICVNEIAKARFEIRVHAKSDCLYVKMSEFWWFHAVVFSSNLNINMLF